VGEPGRSTSEIILHGFYGACLAALLAIPTRFFSAVELSWPVIGVVVVAGMLLGAVFGENAIEFLKRVLWWW
jgi:hypothetical protein